MRSRSCGSARLPPRPRCRRSCRASGPRRTLLSAQRKRSHVERAPNRPWMCVALPALLLPSAPQVTHANATPLNQAALASRASVQAAVEQAERTLANANSALQAAQAGPHAGQAAARKCAARFLLFAPQSGQAVRCLCSEPATPPTAGVPRLSPPCRSASAPELRPSRGRRTRRMMCPWTTRTGAKSSLVRQCRELFPLDWVLLAYTALVQGAWLRTAVLASTTRGGIACRVRCARSGGVARCCM